MGSPWVDLALAVALVGLAAFGLGVWVGRELTRPANITQLVGILARDLNPHLSRREQRQLRRRALRNRRTRASKGQTIIGRARPVDRLQWPRE
jgi:hypothetical protein